MLLNLFIGITGTPHSPILFGLIQITIRDILHPVPQGSKAGTKGHKIFSKEHVGPNFIFSVCLALQLTLPSFLSKLML